MTRKSVLIDPSAPRKIQGTQKRMETLRIQNFQDKHPLARMYRTFHYMLWAREDGYWRTAAENADFFVRGFASLSTDLRVQFEAVIPDCPDPVKGSWPEWCLYLGFLLASKSRREAIAALLEQSIIDGWGVEAIPTIYRTLSSIVVEEAPY